MIGLTKSFRLRIILMTVAVSGAVLISFGLASRQLFFSLKIENVDQRLAGVPVREFPHPEQPWMWERIVENVDRHGERLFGGSVYLISYGKEGKVYFSSEDWPEGLGVERLPETVGELRPIPERLSRREEGDSSLEEFFRRRGGPDGRGRGGPGGFKGGAPIIPTLFTVKLPGQRLRFAAYQFDGHSLALGVDLFEVTEDVRKVQRAFFSALPFALAIVGLGAWLISSGAIKPIRKLTQTAKGMSAQRLNEPIEKSGEDREFEELIVVFNDMLSRLDRSFQQANRFSADAAHELKTPLTIIQGQLELAFQGAEDGSEEQAKFASLLDETQRLKAITRKLLQLAQADAGTLLVNRESIGLKSLLEEAIEDSELQAPEVSFHLECPKDSAVQADRTLLLQIVHNLLGNAVKYNNAEKKVAVTVLREGAAVSVLFENTGEEIGEKLRGDLFERFTRGDEARNRKIDGFGLGLSLSKEFAKALGGDLELLAYENGMNRFKLTLA